MSAVRGSRLGSTRLSEPRSTTPGIPANKAPTGVEPCVHGFAVAGIGYCLALCRVIGVAALRSVRSEFDVSGYAPGYAAAALTLGTVARKRDVKQFRQACRKVGLIDSERRAASDNFHAEKATEGRQEDLMYGRVGW